MNMKRLCILLGLVILVWAAAYLVPDKKKPAPTATEAAWSAPDAVEGADRVEVNGPMAAYVLEKTNGQWRVSQSATPTPETPNGQATPSPLFAKREKVEALFTYLKSHTPIRRLADVPAEQLGQFGLDTPRASLVVHGKRDWTLRLGASNPSGDGVYAQCGDEPGQVLVLDGGYNEQLGRLANHYYDLRLMDFSAEGITSVRVQGPEVKGFELIRRDKGFAFTWPEAITGHAVAEAEANMFLMKLTSLEGASLATALPAGSSSVGVITVSPLGGAPAVTRQLFQTTGPKGPVWLAHSSWQPAWVALDAERMKTLTPDPFSLRDRSVSHLDMGTTARVVMSLPVVEGAKPLSLAAVRNDKDNGKGWVREGTDNALPGLDMLLWRFSDLRFEAEPAAAVPATAKEALRVTISGRDGVQSTDLTFFRDPTLPATQCWVRVSGKDTAYPVKLSPLEELLSLIQSKDTGTGDSPKTP